jgi:hypothetical protein
VRAPHPWRLLSVADRPPAAWGMQGGATARLACATCCGCWSGKLGRAGWHAALTGKAGTCQLRQTPWHSAQTVSARPRSCWSLSAPSGMPPLPHCACAPVHVHRVCRVRVVLTRCLPLRMSLACTRIFFSKTGCARAQAGGWWMQVRVSDPRAPGREATTRARPLRRRRLPLPGKASGHRKRSAEQHR